MKAPAKSSGSSSPAVSILEAEVGRRPARKVGASGGFPLFDRLAEPEHEQGSAYYDPTAGDRGIIAIHSTVLGPALGGTRVWNYASGEEALGDAPRLGRGMADKGARP